MGAGIDKHINEGGGPYVFKIHGQVNYTEENLLDYIDPNNDTLMVRLADDHLLTECRIMLGTDKRATTTTNIREGDICAFRFRITSKGRLVLTVHCL
ncbi:hypothetical protein TRIUR3_04669 [Triticum urartu]|uniref:Uncharacterized protein n=1 Tax=Triticum urartu TaxID=4572 RepID=M7YVD7_TRIUA|nr:hypothetical protein TRIUR3_04669 [Triticum urartu]